MTDKDPATIAKNASIVQRTYEASRQGVNTMTELTDEELRALHEDSRCDCALCKDVRRTIYQAGVASQAARIAELNEEVEEWRKLAHYHIGEVELRLAERTAERDALTRELAATIKAKRENDDRFMGERDQARRELAEAKALIGDLTNVEMWQRTRRAGQPEAKMACPECEGLGEYDDGVMPTRCSKGCPVPPRKVIAAELPGGPGPNTDRLAELERKVARLEDLALAGSTPHGGALQREAIRADRAGKGE